MRKGCARPRAGRPTDFGPCIRRRTGRMRRRDGSRHWCVEHGAGSERGGGPPCGPVCPRPGVGANAGARR
eukprot:5022237-Prymnesium_polylepis.1